MTITAANTVSETINAGYGDWCHHSDVRQCKRNHHYNKQCSRLSNINRRYSHRNSFNRRWKRHSDLHSIVGQCRCAERWVTGTDTLAGIGADLRALTATVGSTDNISGFETIRVTNALGGDLTTTNVQASGISTVRLDGAAAARTITMESGAIGRLICERQPVAM